MSIDAIKNARKVDRLSGINGIKTPSPNQGGHGRTSQATDSYCQANPSVFCPCAPASIAANPYVAPKMPDDPYLWLENIDGKKAMAWVRKQNRKALGRLKSDPRYKEIRNVALDLMEDDSRIPYGTLRGNYIYNVWQDDKHIRGIWRRATVESYRSDEPKWETVLDIDALAKEEGENWVWKGSTCLPTEYERCLLRLSRGGKDAVVVREFDTKSKQFVENGFQLVEAKQSIDWLDRDHILVATDFGPGSLTPSGYSRFIKEWKRGDPLESAKLVFEGERDDAFAYAFRSFRPEGAIDVFARVIEYLNSEVSLRLPDGTFMNVPVPPSAMLKCVFEGQILFVLQEAWHPEGVTKEIPTGTLVAIDAKGLMEKKESSPDISIVFSPSKRVSIGRAIATRDAVYLSILDNLNGKIVRMTRSASNGESEWKSEYLPVPSGGRANVVSSSSFSEEIYINFQNFLTPSSLLRYDPDMGTVQPTKKLEAAFNTEGLVVEQLEAISHDGTRVPYFIVRAGDIPYDGSTPTLLYGYGGFGKSKLPHYSKTVGKLWLEKGGAYVVANIRGGGEFGPDWHSAAIKENRQRSFDDFIAVAEDLISRKITSPRRLGIQGTSNGGLLVGVVAMQRPDLFNAVVSSMPLLDMIRYPQLLAGHSWIGEFGDPENPVMRKHILGYSPYHNLLPDEDYPEIFFTTSTKDDRVHPGHARKMVAKMKSMGHRVLYHENTEGGHSHSVNLRQKARNIALIYTYLFQKLFD